jgi:hypothetical protein
MKMKRILAILIFCFPVLATAQQYPWDLGVFGGGASLCVESGCFGPTGYAIGGSFGRQFSDRWAFELEAAYTRSSEILPGRFDIFTGQFYVPEEVRQRTWAGFAFLGTLVGFGDASNLFVSVGLAVAYEHKYEIVPEGVFAPDRNLGLKGGLSGGAGMNLWITENWALMPEVKFYLIAEPLSGLRYTAGLVHRF